MFTTQMQAKEKFERFKREYQVENPQVVRDWEREQILSFYKYPYEIRRRYGIIYTNFETIPNLI